MRHQQSLGAVLLFSAGLGCSAVEADAGLNSTPTGGVGNGGGSSTTAKLPDSLDFEPIAHSLTSREQVELSVVARPARSYRVRFSLPVGPDDDPGDAVLNRSETDTDETGRASVLLTAPSTTAIFSVRASVEGSVTAQLGVSVNDAGVASVVLQPTYLGRRAIGSWVATARAKATCADRPGIPPPDGALLALSSAGQAPILRDVPAGVPLAITLRSGHYVGGCASMEGLAAAPADHPHRVNITVLDRPLELASSRLAVSLGFAAPASAWTELTVAGRLAISEALLGASTDDADALLDVMREKLSGAARQGFETARKQEEWDSLVRQHWGKSAPTHLRDSADAWLKAGSLVLSQGERGFEGALEPVDATSAELSLFTLAGLPAVDAGLLSPALVRWSAKADDTVVVATDLYLSASRLTAGLGRAPALATFPAADDAPQALALALSCQGLGEVLADAGPYSECEATCLKELCEAATATIWARGREATSEAPARLRLTGAGTASSIGDGAELAGVLGTWVGELSTDGRTLECAGPLVATEPAPEK